MALSPLLVLFLLAAAPPERHTTPYAITTVAGAGDCGDGGPAALARLGAPEGLAVDRAGNVYISDALDHRVRRISPSGIASTVAGTGRPGFRGDGGPAAAARLNAPYGLAFDAAGNLYIADLGNSLVRQVSPDGVIRTVAGGADGVQLNQPRNLALDAAGNLYISDFGDHSVYKLTPGGIMSRVAGTGHPGSVEDGLAVEAALAPLRSPAGLAVGRSGVLYIADSGNHRVRKVQNGLLTTVPYPTQLDTPTGLTLDDAGDLYVADKGMSAVWKLTPAIVRITLGARFNRPRELAFDASGSLYIADTNASAGIVIRVLPSGTVSTFAGGEPIHPPGDDGPAISAYLGAPSGLAIDSSGSLLIADRSDHRVRRISSGTITTAAGIGFPGSGGEGGFANRAQLDGPEDLAFGASGNLWVTEPQAGRVRQIDATGRIFTFAADSASVPAGVGADAAGNIYIADRSNHIVRKLTPDGHSTIFAGTGVPGYDGDLGPGTSALLRNPAGLYLDGAGNLYIADRGNHAIRKVSKDGTITTVAGRGESWFGGDGGPATGAWLNMPSAVTGDSEGNLFIADTGNQRIRKVDAHGIIETIAGPDALDEPAGIAVDSEGGVYVSDRGNGLVRKLTPEALPPPEIEDPPKEEPPELAVTSVVNAASMLGGPVAPGEIATLYGTALDSAQLFFDGEPAALLYVGGSQINFIVPRTTAGRASAQIEIRTAAASLRLIVPVADANPGIFTLAAGTGQAAAENEDGTPNSAGSPAPRGSALTLYATGEGTGTPAAEIGGEPAAIISAVHAAGVLRVKVRVPASGPPGQNQISLISAGARSQPGVTVAVR